MDPAFIPYIISTKTRKKLHAYNYKFTEADLNYFQWASYKAVKCPI